MAPLIIQKKNIAPCIGGRMKIQLHRVNRSKDIFFFCLSMKPLSFHIPRGNWPSQKVRYNHKGLYPSRQGIEPDTSCKASARCSHFSPGSLSLCLFLSTTHSVRFFFPLLQTYTTVFALSTSACFLRFQIYISDLIPLCCLPFKIHNIFFLVQLLSQSLTLNSFLPIHPIPTFFSISPQT